ncbi:MAG: GntR family transcriptional regulator [Acidobacteria bacterium]|nr:GntR family transcriptional regulator [Acidobacteriota bacterium]MCA1632405.1 GntR family transcriptional regulator [Acidobacteriota bacterium]MCA1640747.1 GntR family transcriptional regulator [Acidobacteriota bacterium]
MAQSFNIDARDPTPIYAQLERAIRFSIATGRLSVGDQLPTVRQLAVDLRINANTVAKVYTELERTGIVETRRGVGTFVRAQGAPLGASVVGRRAGDERENRLQSLAQRFLADAHALGFTPEEAMERLEGLVNEGV